MPQISLICADLAATRQLGETLALALKCGDLVTLSGDLGAGKTELARALIRSAAGDEAMEVPSPTFTLVQTYPDLPFGPLAHFDLYRLEDPTELDELGLEDAVNEGVALVEWPERAGNIALSPTLKVTLRERDDESREITISGCVEAVQRVERSQRIRYFLDQHGYAAATRQHLTGDASARRYETVGRNTTGPIILMDSPEQPDGPPVKDGKPYSIIAHLAENTRAFVAIAKLLKDRGFAAPAIIASDLDDGLLLIEDLGAGAIITPDREPVIARYRAAMETLAAIHALDWRDSVEYAEDGIHDIPQFDRGVMLIEVDLLASWYAPYRLGRPLSDAEERRFREIWSVLFDDLADAETSLILRDYHSPNIIWIDEEKGIGRTGLIDFQDALIGPSAYDVASLAQDARVDVSADLEQALVEHYCSARARLNRSAFEHDYAIMAAQRATKILGIFVRLSRRDGKHGYLPHLPRIEAYLDRSLGHPALADYRDWVNTVLR